ncbi:MAG: type II toxin-antitoxin system VapC family toxin [Holosporaceae bacterium]|jgi:predicted nucleic acid-binding protein|nr:type II toxin-antitoxin system VapC family toxin [Holosporaceae bacterium]
MIVLDTSFVVKFVRQELLISFFDDEKKIITTDLFDYEFANVMWKTAKYQALSAGDIRNCFAFVDAIGIERYRSDPMKLFLYATETGLTAYDASYLLLAKKYKCPIATFDKQLIAAANKESIEIMRVN